MKTNATTYVLLATVLPDAKGADYLPAWVADSADLLAIANAQKALSALRVACSIVPIVNGVRGKPFTDANTYIVQREEAKRALSKGETIAQEAERTAKEWNAARMRQ